MSAAAAAATSAANVAADNLDVVISRTLALLQQRLRRLEFLITGDITDDIDAISHGNVDSRSNKGDSGDNNEKGRNSKNSKQQSVKQGLRSVDASLRNLSVKSAGTRQLLELREFLI